jgi:hypothetical protein
MLECQLLPSLYVYGYPFLFLAKQGVQLIEPSSCVQIYYRQDNRTILNILYQRVFTSVPVSNTTSSDPIQQETIDSGESPSLQH